MTSTYGTRLYGEGKYGASGGDVNYSFSVDWLDAGRYVSSGRIIQFSFSRGKKTMYRSDGTGFEKNQIGALNITLRNDDGSFDPYNTSSRYYPNVRPGHKCRLMFVDRTDVTPVVRYMFTGIIKNIRPAVDGGRRIATFEVVDYLAYVNKNISVGPYENIRVDQAIGYTLTAAGYPGTVNTTTSPANMRLFYAAEENALDVIENLVTADFGLFYVDGQGAANFLDRTYNSATPVSLTNSMVLEDIDYPMPWEDERNAITVWSYPKTELSSQTLFSLSSKLYVGAGESISINCPLTYNGSPTTTMSIAMGYMVFNSQEDNSGTYPAYTYSFPETVAGTRVTVTIYNLDTVPGYVTAMQLTGKPFVTDDLKFSANSGAADKVLVINTPYQQNVNDAQAMADYLLATLTSVRPWLTVRAYAPPGWFYEVGTDVTVTITNPAISGLYRVIGIDCDFSATTGKILLTYYLYPITEWVGFTFDQALDDTAILGF